MAEGDNKSPYVAFTFPKLLHFSSLSELAFPCQSAPAAVLQECKKRRRQSCDISVDEPILPSAKKRRLRLVLITSRLSRPFSTPASHIADRGRSRVAVLCRTRDNPNLRGQSLRRAAIINQHRRKSIDSEDGACDDVLTWDNGRNEFLGQNQLRGPIANDDVRGEANIYCCRQPEIINASSRSIQGPSNYEALDQWQAYVVLGVDQDDSERNDVFEDVDNMIEGSEDREIIAVYDFNFIQPVTDQPETEEEGYDDIWAARLPPDWYSGRPCISSETSLMAA